MHIKLITLFDRNIDFIELQYKSILKHVTGDYEYIIANNGHSSEQQQLIQQTCDKFNIKCLKLNPNNSIDSNPSSIHGEALNQIFKHIKNEYIFYMDSDMFFMSNVNLNNLLDKHPLMYIPVRNKHYNTDMMWSGLFAINTKEVKEIENINCGVGNNHDSFGQTYLFTDKYDKKLLKLYSLWTFTDGVITTAFNNYNLMKFKDGNTIFKENTFYDNDISSSNLNKKYNKMIETMEKYNFPQPYYLDFIENESEFFVIHFKSSNWSNYNDKSLYPADYLLSKKSALKLLLNEH